MSNTKKWWLDESSVVASIALFAALAKIVWITIFDSELENYAEINGFHDLVYFWIPLIVCLGVYLARFNISFEIFSKSQELKDRYTSHMPRALQIIESIWRICVGVILIIGLTDLYHYFGQGAIYIIQGMGATRKITSYYDLPPATQLALVSGYIVWFFVACLIWDLILIGGALKAVPRGEKVWDILRTYFFSHALNLALWIVVLMFLINDRVLSFFKAHQLICGGLYALLVVFSIYLSFFHRANKKVLTEYWQSVTS